jgi:DNA-binding CsgD family transcriptional regulator
VEAHGSALDGRGMGIEIARARTAKLTRREREVLERLAEGRATEEVAQLLHVSPHTVRSRVKSLLRKLDARNREHAVAIALTEGAIDPEL